MADERDFELLDDYLTNRMSEQDRSAFEQKLQADPDLQNEFALQKRLLKGIKDARVAELKSMLNKVPVSGSGPETLVSKIALGTMLTLLVAAAAYWYFNRDQIHLAQPQAPAKERSIEEKPVTPKPEPEIKAEKKKERKKPVETQTVETDKNQTSAGTEHSKPSLAKKPAPLSAPKEKTTEGQSPAKEPVLDVLDPAVEESEQDAVIKKEHQEAFTPNSSSLLVETDTENSRYTFHYQFNDGKLFLYGPFEENLYEIMEFLIDEKRIVFLYYKDNYYLLHESDHKMIPLSPITDSSLLKKLKEYRSRK
jgi:hypothetical protein